MKKVFIVKIMILMMFFTLVGNVMVKDNIIAKNHVKILVLLGYPGSGKGTLAQSLNREKFVFFSFGDFMRNEVRMKTDLGNLYKNEVEMKDIKEVTLLPEKLVEKIFEDKILDLAKDNSYIVLDGFPKTIEQAEFLTHLLKKKNIDPVYVYIEVEPSLLVNRIINRRICQNCNQIYNIIFNPPTQNDKCDSCAGNLIIRETDTNENIKKRIKFFDKIMLPLLEFYRSRSLLYEIDGNPPIKAVKDEFLKILIKSGYISD